MRPKKNTIWCMIHTVVWALNVKHKYQHENRLCTFAICNSDKALRVTSGCCHTCLRREEEGEIHLSSKIHPQNVAYQILLQVFRWVISHLKRGCNDIKKNWADINTIAVMADWYYSYYIYFPIILTSLKHCWQWVCA